MMMVMMMMMMMMVMMMMMMMIMMMDRFQACVCGFATMHDVSSDLTARRVPIK